MFAAPGARLEMPFFVLVIEDVAALVGAVKLANVQHVHHVPRHLHFVPLLLAVRAEVVTLQPLGQARSAYECFTVAALCEVLQHIRADPTDELGKDFLKLGP